LRHGRRGLCGSAVRVDLGLNPRPFATLGSPERLSNVAAKIVEFLYPYFDVVTAGAVEGADAVEDGSKSMSTLSALHSMSLDGYIAGPNDEPGNPGRRTGFHCGCTIGWSHGRGGSGRPSGPAGELIDEMNATGAGPRGTADAEQAGHYGGDHHGVPIFVLSHQPPGPAVANYPSVTYVIDGIVSAMAQAKAAAGERNVMVHGAYTAKLGA